MCLSAVTGSGVTDMVRQLISGIEISRAKDAAPQEVEPWSP